MQDRRCRCGGTCCKRAGVKVAFTHQQVAGGDAQVMAVQHRFRVDHQHHDGGAADGDGFVVTVAMTSLTGCSGEAFASILKSLGYASETRKG